jgi:hypothetical protein
LPGLFSQYSGVIGLKTIETFQITFSGDVKKNTDRAFQVDKPLVIGQSKSFHNLLPTNYLPPAIGSISAYKLKYE